MGWTNVSIRNRRNRSKDFLFLIKAIPPFGLSYSLTEVDIGSAKFTLEAEPWSPAKQAPARLNFRTVPLSHFVVPTNTKPCDKPPKVACSDFKDGDALQREKAGEPDIKKARTETGVQGQVDHSILGLGLSAKRVAGLGQCFFHSLSVYFTDDNTHKNSSYPTDAQVLRILTIAEEEARADKVRTAWDGSGPDGREKNYVE